MHITKPIASFYGI
jgi:hypothetical protein